MADHGDRPDDDWGNSVAHGTFWFTVILAILFLGSVLAFILLR